MERFVVATGDNPSHLKEHLPLFDYIVTTPYGMTLIDESLHDRCICYTNPFVHTRHGEKRDYDIYPIPENGDLKIFWSDEFWSFGRRFDHEWSRMFTYYLGSWAAETQPGGILLDDWNPDHKWWACSPKVYDEIHQGIALQRVQWLREIEHGLHAMGALKFPKAKILTNGLNNLDRSCRYWEGVGNPWRPFDWVRRKVVDGDWLYCNSGDAGDWERTLALGEEKGLAVGLGVPDGEPVVDPLGNPRIPLPTA
jgi:hypothetical protein